MKDVAIELIKVLVPLIIGGSIGGLVGFKIGVNKSICQTQKGGDNAVMVQTGVEHNG